jgi:hypothetical protein
MLCLYQDVLPDNIIFFIEKVVDQQVSKALEDKQKELLNGLDKLETVHSAPNLEKFWVRKDKVRSLLK